MKVLIDKRTVIVDNGYELNKQGQRIAFHSSLQSVKFEENQKLVAGGHLYVLNYNPKTYQPKFPETYNEFIENGSKF